MIMLPQIMRLVCLVKDATKSTRAGRWFGGPVRTRHCGLKESCCINQNCHHWLSLGTTEWDEWNEILVEGVNCKMWPEFKDSSEKNIMCDGGITDALYIRFLVTHLKFLTWSSTPDRATEYDKAMLYVPAWTDEPQFTSVDVKTHTSE